MTMPYFAGERIPLPSAETMLTDAISMLNTHVERLKYHMNREYFSDQAWNDLHIAIDRIDEAEQHLDWCRAELRGETEES